MYSIHCPNCNQIIDADSKFCKYCSFSLSEFPKIPIASNNLSRNNNPVRWLVLGLICVVTISLVVFIALKKSASTGVVSGNTNSAISTTATPKISTPVLSQKALRAEDLLQQGESISTNDLKGLSKIELHLLKNVPEARYGSRFDGNNELIVYFESRPWYRPNDNFDPTMLSQKDILNMNIVMLAEDELPPAEGKATSNDTGLSDEEEAEIAAAREQGSSNATSSLEEQAKEQVRKVFEDTSFTRCGDSYYSNDGGIDSSGIAERRSPYYTVEKVFPVTEADRLNGITWKGSVLLRYDAMRIYAKGAWSDWQPYQGFAKFELQAQLRDGSWQTGSTYLLNQFHQKINCSGVPK